MMGIDWWEQPKWAGRKSGVKIEISKDRREVSMPGSLYACRSEIVRKETRRARGPTN